MCWCAGSNSTDCRLTANFLVDFGGFSLIGPYLGQLERTCVSGQTCHIDGFSGALAGSLMVLETCGVLTPSSSLLTADGIFSISTSGAVLGVSSPVTLGASPGQYQLCWCGGDNESFACDDYRHFETDIGQMMILGPRAGQDRTCVTGQECMADGLKGIGLSTADRWFVLETCGFASRFCHSGKNSICWTSFECYQEWQQHWFWIGSGHSGWWCLSTLLVCCWLFLQHNRELPSRCRRAPPPRPIIARQNLHKWPSLCLPDTTWQIPFQH